MIIKKLEKGIIYKIDEKEFNYDDKIFNYENLNLNKIYKKIIKIIKEKELTNQTLLVEDYKSNIYEIILLLALTKFKNNFIYNNEFYELSFAYAIPLYKEQVLFNFVIKNLNLCLENKQIVFLASKTLYLYNEISEEGLNNICNCEKRTIKKNSDTQIKKLKFNNKFFDFWKDYDENRFGEIQTKEFQDFFKLVYNSLNFKLYKFIKDEEVIAYNVCYFSNEQKVIYDVLFPWIDSNKVYRIGIFSIINNLKKAFHMGWGYSICYGIYDYKNKILDKLENS